MAQFQDNTHKKKPRSSGSFLGCFGFSRKVPEKNPQDTVKPRSRKKTRRFSWSRLQMKKSDVKTVPIDASVAVAANRRSPIHSHDKKNNSKLFVPATGAPATQIPATLRDHETVTYKPQKTRHEASQNINLEIHEDSNDADSLKEEKRPKLLSIGRQTEARKSCICPPGSPEKRTNPGRTIKNLSHSVSFPAPKGEKQEADAPGNSWCHGEKLLRPDRDNPAGKFDPLVGMSILTVTLVIMLVWGRLCAVLCTLAWFYFIPRLRSRTGRGGSNVSEENGSSRIRLDFNYQEHKKKVVLEGFLERKRRVPMPQ